MHRNAPVTPVPTDKIYFIVDPNTERIRRALVTPHPIEESEMACMLDTFNPDFLAQNYLAKKDIEAGSTGSSVSEDDIDWE